ncbi:hypothetical protein RJ55_04262 [Drechmeria coniospora]|nr:hypothetical protein RJ55_04262 [Drechmeria coniospora]
MLWTKALLPLLLGICHGGIVPEDGLVRRNPPGANGGSFVFRGDFRSPREIRADGGFQPRGDGWQNSNDAYSISRHYRSGPSGCSLDGFWDDGFNYQTAFVSMARERTTSELYGEWFYEIHATPNILDDGYPEGEVFALGGAHWRQIRRYGRMRNGRIDEADLMPNPEYDRERYERSAWASRCYVSTDFPPELEDGEGEDGDVDAALHAANEWMDSEEMHAILGTFPLAFESLPPRQDIPGPSSGHGSADDSGESEAGDAIRYYMDLGPDLLDALYPEGHRLVQEIFQGINPGDCSLGFLSKRAGAGAKPTGRNKGRAKTGRCCKKLAAFRKKIQTLPGVLPRECTHFDELKLGVQLGDGAYQGTWDTLVLAFGDGEEHTIASSPDPGFHEWQDIKLNETFGTGAVAVDHIGKVEIKQKRDSTWGGDLWKLQGIKLKGRCAGSLTERVLDKFASENKEARHSWSGEVSAKDWKTSVECSHFKRLEVDFTLSNSIDAGTWDDLFVRFENEGKYSDTMVAETPSRGTAHSPVVDLKKVFGEDPVPVRDIRFFDVHSHAHETGWAADWWKTAGIIIKGQCAGSGREAIFDRYEDVYEWFERENHPSDFKHTIQMRDWHWIDSKTGKEVKDAKEF